MRAQTLFVVVSAIAGALAAPIEARDPNKVTVYENVVHYVTATSTVWVKPSPKPDYKPEDAPEPAYPTTTSPAFKYAPNPATTSSSSVYTPPPPPPAATSRRRKPHYSPKPKEYKPKVYAAPSPPSTPTTSTYAPPATPSVAPEDASSDPVGGYSGGGGGDTGKATFYDTGMGSCGKESSDSDHIVAISHILMDAKSTGNPNTNPYCGTQVEISRGAKSVVCTVVDTCPGCDENHFDMSRSAFNTLGSPDEGVIPITYKWVN